MKKWTTIVVTSILLFACSKEKKSEKAGAKMQDFVVSISEYARTFDSDFIVIPQNGTELAYNNLSSDEGLNSNYLSAIDGVGVEELFFYGTYNPDDYRLNMLREIVSSKKVMVSEYVSNNNDIQSSITYNLNEGFIRFPRTANNYNYTEIPDSVINENSFDINTLADAQNYLYLISSDAFSSRQDFLDAIATTNFDVVLIDLFYDDSPFTTTEINQLKTKANGGRRLVISYMNIGAAENYRYYWQDDWKLHRPGWLKKPYDGYEAEIWVKFWKKDWQEIIFGNDDSYTKKIIDAGFDGVYLDNVEAYYFLYFD